MSPISDEDLMAQLRSWCDEAAAVGDASPLAFALATVDDAARPTTRMMSVKELRSDGLVLFMNSATRKGRDVYRRPDVAGTFWWPTLGRQVNLTGTLVELDDDASDSVWADRDRVSRVADSIGRQGEPLDCSLDELRLRAITCAESDDSIVRPTTSKAYLLRPVTVELWTQGSNRIHERLLHLRQDDGWHIVPLHP